MTKLQKVLNDKWSLGYVVDSSSDSHSVVTAPAMSAPSGNMLASQILGSHPRPTEPEILELKLVFQHILQVILPQLQLDTTDL